MYDVIVIGAGAAGLMAAGTAARSGNKVLLLEKMEKAGRKIRITGKGRCNVTNIRPKDEIMARIRANADFFEPSFDDFDNNALVDFFHREGVKLVTERGGRVFPASGKAWDIADALVDWARESGAEIQYHTKVTRIRTLGGKVFGVSILNRKGFERNLECRNAIICTGGLSYPATGSTGDGYSMAGELGHRIEEVRPSLVPLVGGSQLAETLSGVQLRNVAISLFIDGEKAAEEFGEMEFSKRGIEGAVVLRLSRAAVDALIEERRVEISIDLKSALSVEMLEARIARETESMPPEAAAGDLLRKLLPKPMTAPFAREAGIGLGKPMASLTEEEKRRIISLLKDMRIPISDYRSLEEAVVTAGGVAVDGVDPHTLQSRLVKGLYFAGEVLDIDADTGGYNLQVAFSTGHLAGQLKK